MDTEYSSDDALRKVFGVNMDKGEIITKIMSFTNLKVGTAEYNKNTKLLSVLHRYELRDSLVELQLDTFSSKGGIK